MEDTAVAVVSKAMSTLDKAREMFRQNMMQEGDKLAQEALDTGMPSGILNESSINDLGYKYLGEGQKLLALAIFKYNVEKHPASSNAYDSLAEGHMENGQNELAIKFYRKSLELDPRNENARTTIRKLGGEVK
jgi:tetratricopeptide (TPR) repeat protein